MNKKLTFLSVLFILCLFLHMSAFAAEQLPSKEEQEYLAKAFLKAIDVLPNSEEPSGVDMDKNITRGEFAEYIVRAMGGQAEKTGEAMFADVSDNHPYAGYIAAAVRMNLMNGYENGTFLPDYPVRYEEAVKVCIAALGYEPRAKLRGGYPIGYINEAHRLSVLENVSGQTGAFITQGNFFIMMKNMLTAPMLEISEVNASDIILENNSGKTILGTYLEISSDTGKVTCTERTALTGPTTLTDGLSTIGEKTYKSNGSNVNNYIGYNVTAYYKNDNELLFVWPEKYTTLTVNAKNILADSSNFSTTCFVYENENGKVQNADISPYADLLYNGVSVGGYSAEDLKIDRGYIQFTDIDRNGLYDVIFVYSYFDMVAGNINLPDFFIQDIKDTAVLIKLNPNESDKYLFTVEKDGEEYDFSKIEKGDVLSVFESKNTYGKRFKRIIVSKNNVVGTITAKEKESGAPNTVIIGEKRYTTAKYFDENHSSLPIQTKGRFLLNFDGEVTAPAINVTKTYTYGYVITAAISEKPTAKAQFKIISEDGDILTLTANDRVNVDGTIYRNHKGHSELLNSDLIKQRDGSYRQLVRFKLDETGQISELDTIADGAADDEELKKDFSAETRYYLASAFGNDKFDFIVSSSDTRAFIIPETAKDDERQYFARHGMGTFISPGNKYSVAAYDVDDNLTAGAIVVEMDMPKTNGNAKRAMIVDEISFLSDDTVKLTGFQKGQYVTFYIDDSALLKRVQSFKRGDLILPVTNMKDELVYARKLFTPTLDLRIDNYKREDIEPGFDPDDSTITFGDGDNIIFLGSNADDMQDQFRGQYSALLRKDGNKVILSGVDIYSGEPLTENISTMFPLVLPSNASVTICNFYEKSVAKGTLNDLDKYIYNINPMARIFVHTYNGDAKDVFLFDFSD